MVVLQKLYSTKEILFGSREEYLKHQKYLNLLKSLCVCFDKQVADFNFMISSKAGDPVLICKYSQNIKTLKGLISYLRIITKTYTYGDEFGECKNLGSNYFVISSPKFNAEVKEKDMKKFGKIVEELLNSDWVQNVNFKSIQSSTYGNRNDYSLFLSPDSVTVTSKSLGFNSSLSYYPRINSILVNCEKGHVVTNELIENLLYSTFKASSLSDYQRKIIDNSQSKDKKIKFESSVPDSSSMRLNIDELEKSIVLVKSPYRANKY